MSPQQPQQSTTSNQLSGLLDDTEDEQTAYARQLGIRPDDENGSHIPFAAETLPDDRVAVQVNEDLLREVASHILNRTGHVSIVDERGAGKTNFRKTVYNALTEDGRRDEFVVAQIKEVEKMTTRRFYTRLLDELRGRDELQGVIPENYPQATDAVRSVVEWVAERLEQEGMTCIVQVDQMEDVAHDTRRFRDLLAGLQSVGDMGDERPVFLLFLFGTPVVTERIDEIRETLSSRLAAKDRSLERFGFNETAELVGRWLAYARGETYTDHYDIDPFTTGAIKEIVSRTDGTPRDVRVKCADAFRAGARQYRETDTIQITDETIQEYGAE